MKIAVPTEKGLLCPHFGRCQLFTIIDVDPQSKEIKNVETVIPPPHERGVFPKWLNELKCTHIITGGIGRRAINLFEQNGVHVVNGVSSVKPEDAVVAFLKDKLDMSDNPCNDPIFRGKNHGKCHSN
jgi:predicted Fe-Mo cluster-binding NifX family protein